MFGAICGDVLGAPYEVNTVTFKDFILLADNSRFTDDTVCTLAVASSIIDGTFDFAASLRRWGKRFQVPYGPMFEAWIWSDEPSNNSAGNGSVSRIASIPWLADSLGQTLEWAAASAMTSHRHPDSVDAVCAATAAAWLAIEGWPKDRVREVIEEAIGYDLTTPLDHIRPDFGFRLLASETAPVAIRSVLEGNDFEDVMRLSISMGGDADTIAAVAGGIAEAYYPIPRDMQDHVFRRLPPEVRQALVEFNARKRQVAEPRAPPDAEVAAVIEVLRERVGHWRQLIEAGPITFRSRCRKMLAKMREAVRLPPTSAVG
ncbi:ADP-ribosylglycohydrolase family protein [Rhizobium sp. BK176]|uniref:ADP-ribosylglycohydrolase family protein n=1 Tax=Rhizobium sp. BK176 TaxID=2587071 RepID=UPI002166DA86|nr:ADP-ribosylglycohydrolase family protein [Rhizobium sp. BK176]MCS4089329.1 ADP-ribosylglycohydrolase [Rhizobium sp. BK176]